MPGQRTDKRPPVTSNSKPTREVLEVEDEDERERRIGSLLAARAAEPPAKRRRGVAPADFLVQSERHARSPLTPERAGSLLDRVRDFLPALQSSNERLLDQAAVDPNSVDIEYLEQEEDGSDPRYIEMNLGLGVFAMKPSPDTPGSKATDSDDDEDMEDEKDEGRKAGVASGPSDNQGKSASESGHSVDSDEASRSSSPVGKISKR